MRYTSLLAILCLWLSLHAGPVFGVGVVVLVSAAEIDSPAIQDIIEGVLIASPDARVIATDDPVKSVAEIGGAHPPPVIVLGADLLSMADAIEPKENIVGGGFYGKIPTTLPFATYSLDPSIDTIQDTVMGTGFRLKRLLTVSTSERNRERIKGISDTGGPVQVIIKEAKGPRSTARAWFDLLSTLDPASDAVWIMDDGYFDETDSYRHIMTTAWRERIFVLSGLPRFASRGVSVGFVPDLQAYGIFLAKMAQPANRSTNSDNPDYERHATTRFLRRVYNQRTLNHIGYRLPDNIDGLELEDIVLK